MTGDRRPRPGEEGYQMRGTGILMLGIALMMLGTILQIIAFVWERFAQ